MCARPAIGKAVAQLPQQEALGAPAAAAPPAPPSGPTGTALARLQIKNAPRDARTSL